MFQSAEIQYDEHHDFVFYSWSENDWMNSHGYDANHNICDKGLSCELGNNK